MRILPVSLLILPVAAFACGPFFYPAPPTLDHYPERLPGKTMRELLQEANPKPADAASFQELTDLTHAIATDLATAQRDESVRRIDAALARNRAGDYRKRFANCLYDFRDLVAPENAGIPVAELTAYVEWRVAAMEWDDGFFRGKPPEQSWQFSPEQLNAKRQAWEVESSNTSTRLAAEVAKASPAMRPHWLVQAGAWNFRYERFEVAAALFKRVIDESPGHPRAEVAQLMLARVRVEEWRRTKATEEKEGRMLSREALAKADAADEALTAYVTAFPKGRFAPDVPGWRAGVARDRGDLGSAIGLFLEQTDYTGHPEIVRGAVRQIDACLGELELAKVEGEVGGNGPANVLPFDDIARRPIAALAVVYHFLDSESRRDFDAMLEQSDTLEERAITESYLVPMLRMRRAGRAILPALAEAVVRQKESYGGKLWRPKYLAALAWAASESGEQLQAVRLCDLAGPAIDESDDLLFARAVALQRAGELGSAVEAFQRVREKFPQSPVNAETQFRIATCLRDKHEAGLAVVELLRMQASKARLEQRHREQQPDEVQAALKTSAPELHLTSEIDQWADTLLKFAPLEELERGLHAPDLEQEIAKNLRKILRLRSLAREDFASVRGFEENAEPPADQLAFDSKGSYPRELSGADWQEVIEKLERMRKEADSQLEPSMRANKLYRLAEMWASVRGHVTLPSSDDADLFRSEPYSAWGNRSRNARVAGLSNANAAAELESWDELRHAFGYFLKAADAAPGTAVSARALWQANDALRRMAELSPWSMARAFETNSEALSRQLYQRLQRENPTSEEATRLSVWWNFPPPPEVHWLPGDLPHYDAEVAIADAFRGDGETGDSSPLWNDYRKWGERLKQLAANAGSWDTAKLLDELAAIRRDFLPVVAGPRGSWVINHLDDLTLFLQEPGLTSSVRTKYFAARLSDAPPSLDDPEMRPWLDYLTFLALAREHGPEDPETGREHVRPMSERMREFLTKFPRSRKREAALARLAVATAREARGHTGVVSTDWPEAPRQGGYYKVAATRAEPFDAKSVFSAIDSYEKEYPNGLYTAEMRFWRGAASIDTGDWNTAIDLLTATLDDKTKRDLHLDAALNLAAVFMRLLETPEARPEIITALARNPSARTRLQQFMYSDTLGARLRCLESYLSEQFSRQERSPKAPEVRK